MIVRTPREPGTFYQASVASARDVQLSFAARGLLSFVFSHTDDWQIRSSHLVGSSPAGEEHVYSLLDELGLAGYVERRQDRSGGRFGAHDYVFFESGDPERAARWKTNPAKNSAATRRKQAAVAREAAPAPKAPPAATPPAKTAPKGSAPTPPLAAPSDEQLSALLEVFNANRGELPPATVGDLTEKHLAHLGALYARDGEASVALLADATRQVAQNPYWVKQGFGLGVLSDKVRSKANEYRRSATVATKHPYGSGKIADGNPYRKAPGGTK